MLGIVTHYVVALIPSSEYLLCASLLTAALLVRFWSAGFVSKEERNLNDKTFVLVVRGVRVSLGIVIVTADRQQHRVPSRAKDCP